LPVVAERVVEPGLLTDVSVDTVGLGIVVVPDARSASSEATA
jgi:hypothetical protein